MRSPPPSSGSGSRRRKALLRESRAAHDEDLRRADRRFEEEKLRKEWNDARRAYERRLDDAHSERGSTGDGV